MNRWRIPEWLEREVVARDTKCIYCGIEFAGQDGSRGSRASWEHIINDAAMVSRENIALCCISCNASKGAKSLSHWLLSRYCSRKAISSASIARVAQDALCDESASAAMKSGVLDEPMDVTSAAPDTEAARFSGA
jgi:hypothetical protein